MKSIVPALLLFMTVLLPTAPAQTSKPLIYGIDDIPLVVANLEKAQSDFLAMGFAIKPGRPHANGIRNAPIKFPNGTEIELITAPLAVDALTTEYQTKLQSAEGPVYFGLYAPHMAGLTAKLLSLHVTAQAEEGTLDFPPGSPLHPLFFGQRNKSPTDKPENFAHPNTATRLSAPWVRDSQQLRELLGNLGVPLKPAHHCGPFSAADGTVATLPDGIIYLVPSARKTVIAARVEVRHLSVLPTRTNIAYDPSAVWLPPTSAHGIWLEFKSPPQPLSTVPSKHQQPQNSPSIRLLHSRRS